MNDSSVHDVSPQKHAETGKTNGSNFQHLQDTLPEECRIISDTRHGDMRITICETPDTCRLYFSIAAESKDTQVDQQYICQLMRESGITAEINTSVISDALAQIAAGKRTVGPVCICGTPTPAAETDVAFEILFNQRDPCVEKGDPLLRLIVPGHGNVNAGSSEPDGPDSQVIVTGPHVVRRAKEYFSEIFGRAVFKNNFLAVHKIIDITVSDDAMEACLSYSGTKDLSREWIEEELQTVKITTGIDTAAIDGAVESFNRQHLPLKRIVIARGIPAQPGRDGRISFFFDTATTPHFTERKDGSVDLRETHLVQCVTEGSEVAALTPHIDSAPGRDVYGRAIPVKPVHKVSLAAGKNVRVSEDSQHFFAEKSGRPLIESGRISISEQLVVSGNLTMSVGNIDFDGDVEIQGDVEDGYRVKATKSVIIQGFVGASDIEAGLDIMIDGGCNGHGKSHLISGRDIQARYIDEAQLIATGDVRINNELINAYIRCLGRVTVQQGKICGGKIMAKKGIESFDLGAEVGTATLLKPGHDFQLKEQCRSIEKNIAEKQMEMEKVKRVVEPLLHNQKVLQQLPADKQEKLDETLKFIQHCREELQDLQACKEELIDDRLHDSLPEVIVHRYVHPGVLIKTGRYSREITSQLEGPLRLFEDAQSQTISLEPYTGKEQASA